MTDINTICKTLPNATNSNKFVDVLRSHALITDQSYYESWRMTLLNRLLLRKSLL